MSEEIEGTKTTEVNDQNEMDDKVISPEKVEEAKLKARYPNLGHTWRVCNRREEGPDWGDRDFEMVYYSLCSTLLSIRALCGCPMSIWPKTVPLHRA
ncbi:cAMP-regulated phosphoprotein 19 [Salmo salar]|uniref:cAMP-regulated phosphoprotein 19 n=1 Tax=Salmo salar TaxID=8030 RepID=B5XCI7_SALSA|nr:cAMP-regulated phosphoprotein 19 [Salmo salar]ACI68557.1 cAMP-regulated phosphoprotein 19 [Salmo salar]|eukprot:NP_001134712.1 cAMP-regulated phosphoprotein 19 [Salmo salar]